MTDIFNSVQCMTGPTAYWTVQYEYKRTGADMYYRFYWKVWLAYSSSRYDYAVSLKLFLDGVEHSVKVKDAVDYWYQWSVDGTTDWYKVTGKTSGTTAFYAQLYDTTRSQTMATSSTYNLAVSAAASVLGNIANFNIGNEIALAITKYNSAFTDTLVVSYGSTTIKTISGVVNGTKISFTSTELSTIYSLMSTVKSGTFTFALTTKSGSTTLGTSTKTATGTITNANPTFTVDLVSYSDIETAVTDITKNNQHIVQNKSKLRVTLKSATGNKGASITKYDVTVNGVVKTVTAAGNVDFGTVNTSQNTDVKVVVTDSRGNTTTITKTITILAYASPTFTVVLERLNNYEDETYLTVTASTSSVNELNTLTINYKKKQNNGNYGDSTPLTNRVKHTTTCDKNYAYTFSITVKDAFETITKDFPLPKGKFPLFIDTEKNSVGINEFPTDGEALHVAGGVAMFEDGIVLKTATKKFKLTINDSGTIVITQLS